jgi:heat shock protein HslJ
MKISKIWLTVILMIPTCGQPAAQTQAPARTESPGAEKKLADTHWRLASFVAPGGETPVVEGTTVTLKFGADGRAGGSSGCNSYGGEYREQGENLSFSRIISTKRACLEQSANQQEQRYFAALESVGRFQLADTRLTIFHGDGRSALNFVSDAPAKHAGRRYENLSSPVALLASFYDAVNAGEYERAYRYWETPPGALEEFARGYAETASVRLIVEPPTRVEGAAGSLYTEVPAVLVARQRDGGERFFAGCYVARKSNLRPTDVPKEEVWRIYRASLSPVAADAALPKLLAQACGN